MSLANCVRCGKVFMRLRNPMCPDCQKQEDELFERVVAYLKENPGASVAEAATDLDIDVDVITKFIRAGRLASVKPSWQVTCRECGAAITSGEYCNECRNKLAEEISRAGFKRAEGPKKQDEGQAKIFLYDRVKRN